MEALVDELPVRLAARGGHIPSAFLNALQSPESDQNDRSRHHIAFLNPQTAGWLLDAGSRRLRRVFRNTGVPLTAVEAYVSVRNDEPALEAALAWYRAPEALRTALGLIVVPTLYIWGDQDSTVSRLAAEGTASYVSAAYRFEVLAGIGHFITDQAPGRVNQLLLEHLAHR